MSNAERIAQLEADMAQLTDVHRAVAARHDALFQVCKVMFALMSVDPALRARLLIAIYDETNERMEKAGFDDEYQQAVRAAIDELSGQILKEAGK
jgi:hypothetical protein